jgi:murein DD-endopeptidase MepM/ murein hydrolase activator NlpD
VNLVKVFSIFFLFSNSTLLAGEVKLSGSMIQGGLIIGWATPGAKIKLDGSSITQSEAGDFLLGFPRDAKSKFKLEISFKDGSSYGRILSIEQRVYDTQKINGLPKRKVNPNDKDLSVIRSQSKLINKSRLVSVMNPFFKAGFVRPVIGRISGVFGSQRILNGKKKRPHYGLDLAAPEGSAVKATSDGIVVFTHNGMFFNGKTIIINHGLALRSTYIHMNSILVKNGMRVKKGQIVGTVGKTGRATGPHLHWGLHLNHIPLDPKLLLKD